MELLETLEIAHPSGPKAVKLYRGDLSAIPPEEQVDLLVVSAFRDNYVPMPGALIGALDGRGLSVAKLAEHKEVDLRQAFSCWLSKDLTREHPGLGFRRLLCFEPAYRGPAPEVVGDIFRSIMPFVLSEPPIHTIAMPIVASGNQRADSEVMLAALFQASVQWLEHGLPVETIKIVTFAEEQAARLRSSFAALKAAYQPALRGSSASYDCFVSYAREDTAEVEDLIQTLKAARPGVRVFLDKHELHAGDSWQAGLDEALERCRKVIAVYSPAYLHSKVCIEEFNMARLRHRETQGGVLLPVYLRSAELPLYMRAIQYIDCREGDRQRLEAACRGELAAGLSA